MTPAALCDAEDRQAVSILSASTKPYPIGIRMRTKLDLMECRCDAVAWDTIAGFIACG